MSHTVSNSVRIEAPLSDVMEYFVPEVDGAITLYFNLARLWPERFEHEDGPHFRNADTAWMEEHLGSAYNPGIGEFGGDGQLATLLHFETPWFPIA